MGGNTSRGGAARGRRRVAARAVAGVALVAAAGAGTGVGCAAAGRSRSAAPAGTTAPATAPAGTRPALTPPATTPPSGTTAPAAVHTAPARHYDIGVIRRVLRSGPYGYTVAFDRYTLVGLADDAPQYFGDTPPLGHHHSDYPFANKSTRTTEITVSARAVHLAVSPASPCVVNGEWNEEPIRWVATPIGDLFARIDVWVSPATPPNPIVELTYDRATGVVTQLRDDAGC